MHECEYIHGDVKLENYLVCGINLKQQTIINTFMDNLKLFYNIKLHKNMKNQQIIESSESIFKIVQKIFNKDMDNENMDEDEISNSEYSDDSSDDKSTFYSDEGDFLKEYDMFHIDEIFKNCSDYYDCDVNIETYDSITKDNEQKFFLEQLKNVKIIINDFGLIMHKQVSRTSQYVNFRYCENILGNITSYETDEWALKMCIHELLHEDLYFDIKNHEYYGLCENNLLVLYYLKKKVSCKGLFKSIYFNKYCIKYI